MSILKKNISVCCCFVVLLNLVLLVSSCSSGDGQSGKMPTSPATVPPNPEPIATRARIIYYQREKAKEAVLKLKRDYSTGKISDSQHEKGQSYYNQAKAAFNAWIFEIDTALVENSPLDTPDRKKFLDEAVNSSEKFLEYVASGYPKERLVPYSAELGDPAKPYLDAALEIVKIIRSATNAQKQEMRQQIQSLKWEDFDKI